jgi:hypothetical protein
VSSDLVAFTTLIYRALEGVDEYSRTAAFTSNTDIDWFINALDEAGRDAGLARCGDDAMCLADALMVFGVEPLLTPERRGLADVAIEQLEANGVTVERATQPFERVLSVAGSTESGWLEGRILASRGWVFLVTAPSERGCSDLVELLDDLIANVEGPAKL